MSERISFPVIHARPGELARHVETYYAVTCATCMRHNTVQRADSARASLLLRENGFKKTSAGWVCPVCLAPEKEARR